MKSKKAVSEIIGYVLLVTLSIALSVIVYAWLKGFAIPFTPKVCPDGVSIIIKDYTCDLVTGEIAVNLSNKGLFKVDGYIFRINNEREGSDPKGLPVKVIAVVTLPSPLNPGEVTPNKWNYRNLYTSIVEMEVQPFRMEGNKKILCDKAVIRQRTGLTECN